jgi:hypothetical protein
MFRREEWRRDLLGIKRRPKSRASRRNQLKRLALGPALFYVEPIQNVRYLAAPTALTRLLRRAL